MSKAGRNRLHPSKGSTALVFATILGLSQAATLIFADKPLLGVMGLSETWKYYQEYMLQVFLLYLDSRVYLYISFYIMDLILLCVGFSYASPCSEVLEIEILRCTCNASILGHARNLSRVQGHSNPFICHWDVEMKLCKGMKHNWRDRVWEHKDKNKNLKVKR